MPLYEIGAMTRFLLSVHFDICAAYAQYRSLKIFYLAIFFGSNYDDGD